MTTRTTDSGQTRRAFALGALGAVGGAVLLTACGDDAPGSTADAATTPPPPPGDGPDAALADAGTPPPPPPGDTPDAATTPPPPPPGDMADAGGPGTCTLYPKETEGPFYLDLNDLRSDIKDGKAGAPVHLVIRVVSASACAAKPSLAVDVWHADAEGLYSGYTGQGDSGDVDTTGERFLRGTQVTDANGQVAFDTIYPGWYHGRTTHIHFKVHVTASSIVTSQLYFPENVTSAVYATGAYAARGQKDTSNASDGIAHSGGGLPPLLAVTGNPTSGYTATITVTVAGT